MSAFDMPEVRARLASQCSCISSPKAAVSPASSAAEISSPSALVRSRLASIASSASADFRSWSANMAEAAREYPVKNNNRCSSRSPIVSTVTARRRASTRSSGWNSNEVSPP